MTVSVLWDRHICFLLLFSVSSRWRESALNRLPDWRIFYASIGFGRMLDASSHPPSQHIVAWDLIISIHRFQLLCYFHSSHRFAISYHSTPASFFSLLLLLFSNSFFHLKYHHGAHLPLPPVPLSPFAHPNSFYPTINRRTTANIDSKKRGLRNKNNNTTTKKKVEKNCQQTRETQQRDPGGKRSKQNEKKKMKEGNQI